MVVAVDVAAAGADATVQTNNVQAGEIACQYIVDKLGRARANVIIQNGPQVSAVIDRVNGLQGGAGQESRASRSCPTTRTARARARAA